MKTIYSQRREMSHFEIYGIVSWLEEEGFLEEGQDMNYSDSSIHADYVFDTEDITRIAYFMVTKNDLYVIKCVDTEEPNKTFRYCRGNDKWQELDEDFTHLGWFDFKAVISPF